MSQVFDKKQVMANSLHEFTYLVQEWVKDGWDIDDQDTPRMQGYFYYVGMSKPAEVKKGPGRPPRKD